MIEIKNRFTGAVIHTHDGDTLAGANLSRANLCGANLCGVHLSRANLYGANLCGANLSRANLYGAALYRANLSWSSHDLLAELLRRAAGTDIEKRKVAGLVLISRDLCWEQFLALDDPLTDWALDVLAQCVRLDDGAPDVLRKRAEKITSIL